jgi:hypothetical protein
MAVAQRKTLRNGPQSLPSRTRKEEENVEKACCQKLLIARKSRNVLLGIPAAETEVATAAQTAQLCAPQIAALYSELRLLAYHMDSRVPRDGGPLFPPLDACVDAFDPPVV